MPTVTVPNLTLTESEGQVTVRVRYTTTFNPLERQLAGLGMEYHSHVTAHGVDTPGATLGPSIAAVDFPTRTFPVTVGTVDQEFDRDESEIVDRSVLQEDTGGERDEIKCKILIHSVGLPPEFTPQTLTDQETLLG